MLMPSRDFCNIYIIADQSDFRYMRRVQAILEETMGDDGSNFHTFYLHRTKIQNRDTSQVKEAMSTQYFEDINNENMDAVLVIRRTSFERITHAHNNARAVLQEQMKKPIYEIDIDDSNFILENDELDRRLILALDAGFTDNPEIRFDNSLKDYEVDAYNLAVKFLQQRSFSLEVMYDLLVQTDGLITKALPYAFMVKNVSSPWANDITDVMIMPIEYTGYSQVPHGKAAFFISHSTRDLPIVRKIQILVEEQGIRTHFFRFARYEYFRARETTEDINSREERRQSLIEALGGNEAAVDDFISGLNSIISGFNATSRPPEIWNSIKDELESEALDGVFYVKSPHSDQSLWTLLEKQHALSLGKPVFEVDITDCLGLSGDALNSLLHRKINLQHYSPLTTPNFDIPTDDLWLTIPVFSMLKLIPTGDIQENVKNHLGQISKKDKNVSSENILIALNFLLAEGRASHLSDEQIDQFKSAVENYAWDEASE